VPRLVQYQMTMAHGAHALHPLAEPPYIHPIPMHLLLLCVQVVAPGCAGGRPAAVMPVLPAAYSSSALQQPPHADQERAAAPTAAREGEGSTTLLQPSCH
jgi:hypothetical protein